MITDQEFEAILADVTKRIEGPLGWREQENHPHTKGFRVRVWSESGWPITAIGSWNPQSSKLSYTLLHSAAGRIVGLDLGKVKHRNPSSEWLHGTHKHRWTSKHRDKWAYNPDDITATWDQPLMAWEQFCVELKITHQGRLHAPATPEELLP